MWESVTTSLQFAPGAAARAAIFFVPAAFAAAGALSLAQGAAETPDNEKKRGSHTKKDQQQLHIHEYHLLLDLPARRAGLPERQRARERTSITGPQNKYVYYENECQVRLGGVKQFPKKDAGFF